MGTIQSWSFLRRALMLDAVASGAMGVGLLTLSGVFAGLLDLPADLLREAGILLVPFAAFVAFLATRAQPSRIAVWIVIAINLVWVVDSIVLLFTGWVEPNALGYAFIIAQAAAVALFADLEYVGLRKAATVAA